MTINLNIVVADPSVIIRSGFDATLKRIQGLRFHIDEVSAIDTLYEYTPIQTDPNKVDLGFEDPFLTTDLTDPNSYTELFK